MLLIKIRYCYLQGKCYAKIGKLDSRMRFFHEQCDLTIIPFCVVTQKHTHTQCALCLGDPRMAYLTMFLDTP